MPKIRGIKPEYWTDEDIVELSLPARLLFIGLWNLACDNGHVPDKPKQIKMRLLPADDVDVDALLNELAGTQRLERDEKTITILNFAKHQKPHRRWWTTCDLAMCEVPDDAPEQGYNRGPGSSGTTSQPGNNGGTTVGHGGTTADVDGEGDVDSDGEGELKGRRKRPATRLPHSWQPNDQHTAFAAERRIDLNREVEQFRDHALANDRSQVDWNAAFRQWLRNARPSRTSEPVAHLAPASTIEPAPDGLSDEEYATWYAEQRARGRA